MRKLLIGIVLAVTALLTVNVSSAYCWRDYYGNVHCRYRPEYPAYYGPGYYGPRYYGPVYPYYDPYWRHHYHYTCWYYNGIRYCR